MVSGRVITGLAIWLVAALAIAVPCLAEADHEYGASGHSDRASSLVQSAGGITITSPAEGASYAAYPAGEYSFPDRSGTFSPALFEGSADLVTVRWQAPGVTGDVSVRILMEGEAIHTGTVAASAGSYSWRPAAAYGQPYGRYADCQAVVTSVLDPAVQGISPTFAIVPWGTVVQEWNGLKVYGNFPHPAWMALSVNDIPVFGDTGTGFRYQCVELAQRWTTRTQHWQDENGHALPDHWAGLYAKDMLTTAQGYGLATVSNDHTATSPPDTGDLLVWNSGEYGHVGVVGAVEGDHLVVYEQNGANLEGTRTLTLRKAAGTIWVDEGGVCGWIKPLARYAFSDIEASPHRTAIQGLAKGGIVSGYPDGTFRPDETVIRQQFAKMIVKTLDLTVTGSEICPFADVPERVGDDPFYPSKYVAVCAANGITTGKTATTFDPWERITRQQLVTMVARAAHLSSPPSDYVPPFSQGRFSTIDHYDNARRAAYAGLLEGIVGMGESYAWVEAATRGEVCALLYHLLQR